MNRIDLLRQAVELFRSPVWIELIAKEKQEKLDTLTGQLINFEKGRDEFDDFLRGNIFELKYDLEKLKDIYEKELDDLVIKQKEEVR